MPADGAVPFLDYLAQATVPDCELPACYVVRDGEGQFFDTEAQMEAELERLRHRIVAVKHALAEHRVARNVLVAAHDGEGHIGWGESCPRTYVTGENVVGARELLRSRILPDLVGTEADSFEAVTRRMQNALEGVKRARSTPEPRVRIAVLASSGEFAASVSKSSRF